jgi:hypothetical protein
MEFVMHTGTIRHYVNPRFLSALLAVSILANVALAGSALSNSGHLPFTTNAAREMSATPMATSAASGHEGTLKRSVAAAAIQTTRVLTSAAPPAIPYGDPGHESSFEKDSR